MDSRRVEVRRKVDAGITGTVGVEIISHFSAVVQKINHELDKILIANLTLNKFDGIDGMGRIAHRLKDISYTY